jgi:transcriptional regulator with XRE-family HTH domain
MISLTETEQTALRALGTRLRAARKRRGDRQEDAAARCGVSVLTYQRMESGFPGTAIGIWIRATRLYGELKGLEALFPVSLFDLAGQGGRR